MSMCMRQEMRLEQYMTLQQKCSVCGLPHNSDDSSVEAVLFGSVKYAICCCCRQLVDKDTLANRAYKTRWGRWYRMHYLGKKGM